MPKFIMTGVSERMPLNFKYTIEDPVTEVIIKKDLTGYTVTPIIYEIGTTTVYKTGAAAGTITWINQSEGKFQFLPAADLFISGKFYNLRFKFTSGDETYEKLNFDVEYEVR